MISTLILSFSPRAVSTYSSGVTCKLIISKICQLMESHFWLKKDLKVWLRKDLEKEISNI